MLSDVNHRLGALRQQAQRDYWTGVARLAILATTAMQVPFLYAAWRLFCSP